MFRMNSMKFQISVIIPSHNPDLGILTKCLAAVHDSSYEPLEVILVDDGSSVDYPKLIERYCVIVKNKRNMGPAYARNVGAQLSRGNILFFIDADVMIKNNTLAEVVKKFSNDDIVAVQTIYSKTTPVKGFLSQYQNLYQHYSLMSIKQKYLCRLSSHAVAVRRSVFLEVNGFPEFVKNPSVEDGMLGVALHRKGYRILLAKDIQVEHSACFDIQKLLRRTYIMGRDAAEHSWGRQKLKKDEVLKTHHKINVCVSVLFSPLIFFTAAVFHTQKNLIALTLFIFLFINSNFFFFVYTCKGLFFMLKSIFMFYLVCFIVFLGLLKGSINYLIHEIYRIRQ